MASELVVELASVPQVEKTFALIKPDAVSAGRARDILHLIEHHGFTIVAKKRMQVSGFTCRILHILQNLASRDGLPRHDPPRGAHSRSTCRGQGCPPPPSLPPSCGRALHIASDPS